MPVSGQCAVPSLAIGTAVTVSLSHLSRHLCSGTCKVFSTCGTEFIGSLFCLANICHSSTATWSSNAVYPAGVEVGRDWRWMSAIMLGLLHVVSRMSSCSWRCSSSRDMVQARAQSAVWLQAFDVQKYFMVFAQFVISAGSLPSNEMFGSESDEFMS